MRRSSSSPEPDCTDNQLAASESRGRSGNLQDNFEPFERTDDGPTRRSGQTARDKSVDNQLIIRHDLLQPFRQAQMVLVVGTRFSGKIGSAGFGPRKSSGQRRRA